MDIRKSPVHHVTPSACECVQEPADSELHKCLCDGGGTGAGPSQPHKRSHVIYFLAVPRMEPRALVLYHWLSPALSHLSVTITNVSAG